MTILLSNSNPVAIVWVIKQEAMGARCKESSGMWHAQATDSLGREMLWCSLKLREGENGSRAGSQEREGAVQVQGVQDLAEQLVTSFAIFPIDFACL